MQGHNRLRGEYHRTKKRGNMRQSTPRLETVKALSLPFPTPVRTGWLPAKQHSRISCGPSGVESRIPARFVDDWPGTYSSQQFNRDDGIRSVFFRCEYFFPGHAIHRIFRNVRRLSLGSATSSFLFFLSVDRVEARRINCCTNFGMLYLRLHLL